MLHGDPSQDEAPVDPNMFPTWCVGAVLVRKTEDNQVMNQVSEPVNKRKLEKCEVITHAKSPLQGHTRTHTVRDTLTKDTHYYQLHILWNKTKVQKKT